MRIIGLRNPQQRTGQSDRTSGDGRIRELEMAFQKFYPAVQYAFVQFLSEHLTDCSTAFKGDLQEMLVLAIVGQAYLEGVRRGIDGARIAVTASSISQVSGIPRETIRRKLSQLGKKNWIVQLADQSWCLKVDSGVSNAKQSLSALDTRGIMRVAKLFGELELILQRSASEGLRAARGAESKLSRGATSNGVES